MRYWLSLVVLVIAAPLSAAPLALAPSLTLTFNQFESIDLFPWTSGVSHCGTDGGDTGACIIYELASGSGSINLRLYDDLAQTILLSPDTPIDVVAGTAVRSGYGYSRLPTFTDNDAYLSITTTGDLAFTYLSAQVSRMVNGVEEFSLISLGTITADTPDHTPVPVGTPEPASLALIGLGLGAAAIRQRLHG